MVILVAIMPGIVLHQVGSVAVKTSLTVDHIPIKAGCKSAVGIIILCY